MIAPMNHRRRMTELRLQETPLQVSFLGIGLQREEVKVVGVFDDLLGQLGLRDGKRSLKVGGSFTLSGVEAGFDLVNEDVSAPALLEAKPFFRKQLPIFRTTSPRPRSPLYPALSHILQRYFSRVPTLPATFDREGSLDTSQA